MELSNYIKNANILNSRNLILDNLICIELCHSFYFRIADMYLEEKLKHNYVDVLSKIQERRAHTVTVLIKDM